MAESEQPFRDHLQRPRDILKHCGITDDQIEERLKLCKKGIKIVTILEPLTARLPLSNFSYHIIDRIEET